MYANLAFLHARILRLAHLPTVKAWEAFKPFDSTVSQDNDRWTCTFGALFAQLQMPLDGVWCWCCRPLSVHRNVHHFSQPHLCCLRQRRSHHIATAATCDGTAMSVWFNCRKKVRCIARALYAEQRGKWKRERKNKTFTVWLPWLTRDTFAKAQWKHGGWGEGGKVQW